MATLSPLQRAMFALKETQDRLDALQQRLNEPIAVVGMSCRFPGAVDDPAAYWRLLCEGVDAVDEIPAERWNIDDYYDPDPQAPGKMNTRWGGFVRGIEQIGLATSTNLMDWTRHAGNPIVRNRPGGYDERFCADGKVFRADDHWVMFYFGVGQGGAHIMAAFSRDLVNWTAHPEPLYKAGGHPDGLDKTYAHKISLVYHSASDTFYMHYCATGAAGRGIGLITSKPLN